MMELLPVLKHFKDDVKEVGNAQEGGLMVEDFNDVEIDDTFEVYKMVEIERKIIRCEESLLRSYEKCHLTCDFSRIVRMDSVDREIWLYA